MEHVSKTTLATIVALITVSPWPGVARGTPEHGTGDLAIASPAPQSAQGFAEPHGILSLRDALAAALIANPMLAAFSWEIRAREAEALQARLRPNPVLASEFENFAGTGDRRAWETTETTVSLSQLVQLGGKRAKAHRLAKLEERLAGWDYEAARLRVLSDTTKAFVRLLALQERARLADELTRLARTVGDTVRATVKAGAVSPVEEARAAVALSKAEIARAQLGHELVAARAALAAAWGSSAPGFERVVGELEHITVPPPLDGVLAAVTSTPDLARWTTELEARAAMLSLEQARRIPDITVRLGGRHFADDDDTALVAEVDVPLPLFDRNQGAIGAAEHRLRKTAGEQRAAETSIRAEIAAAHQALAAAHEQALTLRDATIPQAERLYDGAAEAYAKGLFRYLEVLDAQRTLFELRGQYLETLASYHAAVAELERLSGTTLDPTQTGEQRR